VLSFPFQLRFLFASHPLITGQVLGIVYRVISMHLVKKAGYSKKTARTGAVTFATPKSCASVVVCHQRVVARLVWGAIIRAEIMAQTKSRSREGRVDNNAGSFSRDMATLSHR